MVGRDHPVIAQEHRLQRHGQRLKPRQDRNSLPTLHGDGSGDVAKLPPMRRQVIGKTGDGVSGYRLPEKLKAVIDVPAEELQQVKDRGGAKVAADPASFTQAGGKVNPVPPQLPAGFPPEFLALLAGARATSDIQSAFRAELKALDGAIRQALGRTSDRATRAHLEHGLVQIDRILNPRR